MRPGLEIGGAGCPACKHTIELVEKLACLSCGLKVPNMSDPATANGGELVSCCSGRRLNRAVLRATRIEEREPS